VAHLGLITTSALLHWIEAKRKYMMSMDWRMVSTIPSGFMPSTEERYPRR
jgi:hypothetical protein